MIINVYLIAGFPEARRVKSFRPLIKGVDLLGDQRLQKKIHPRHVGSGRVEHDDKSETKRPRDCAAVLGILFKSLGYERICWVPTRYSWARPQWQN